MIDRTVNLQIVSGKIRMAGIDLQDLFKGCILVILIVDLCPCVCTDIKLCEQNCTCFTHRLSSENSDLKAKCTCPRFGVVPENIRQEILVLELNFSEPVILTRGILSNFQRIRSLDLLGVQFVQPGGFQGLETLRKLVLRDNFMRVLETAMFSELGNLTHLTVEGRTKNKIHAVENGTFVGLTKLEHLVLKGNAIAVIAEEYFRDLQSLNTLDMSKNNLTQIKANAFMNSPSLTQLTLSNNQITEIHRHAFIDLIKLKTLSLDGNQIRGMPQPMFGRLSNVLHPRPTLDLDNNPLRCDCHLNWISSSLGFYHCDGSCLTPGEFKNKPVQEVYKDGLLQCRPNNTVLSVQPGEQLKLTCPLAGASWRTPDGRHFQEHGDCQDLFCLTNSDSLVIWKTSPETSGNYTCSSSDGSQEYFYQVSIKELSQSLTIAMGAGIAAGGFLVVVMSIVIGCKLRPKPRAVPIDAHYVINEPGTDQSSEEVDHSADGGDHGDSDSLLRTDKYDIGAANFIDILQKESLSGKLNINILKSNTL